MLLKMLSEVKISIEIFLLVTVPGKIAIVEHVVGNVFRSRIFPINKGRTMNVKVVDELFFNGY